MHVSFSDYDQLDKVKPWKEVACTTIQDSNECKPIQIETEKIKKWEEDKPELELKKKKKNPGVWL